MKTQRSKIREVLGLRGWTQMSAGMGSTEYERADRQVIISLVDGDKDGVWFIYDRNCQELACGIGMAEFGRAYMQHAKEAA